MNTQENPVVLYWDASAVLSALFKDNHSLKAHQWANRAGYHPESVFFGECPAARARDVHL